MGLELTNWQQVEDYLKTNPKLSLQLTERQIKGEEEKGKRIIIQLSKNNRVKTIYRKNLKSGEELQDIELNSYVIDLLEKYAEKNLFKKV